MIGMNTVVKARKQGLKPFSVFVQLVHHTKRPSDGRNMGHTGIVTVQIGDNESVNDIDFRPLKGLKVSLEDATSKPLRQNTFFAAIQAVGPASLWMPQYDDNGDFSVFTHFAPAPTLEEVGL